MGVLLGLARTSLLFHGGLTGTTVSVLAFSLNRRDLPKRSETESKPPCSQITVTALHSRTKRYIKYWPHDKIGKTNRTEKSTKGDFERKMERLDAHTCATDYSTDPDVLMALTESNLQTKDSQVTRVFPAILQPETGGDREGDRSQSSISKCQVCCFAAAKYRCPRCEKQTCSLPCVKQHKISSGCSGERDKTAFVDMSLYSDKDLLNDYRFLEDAERKLFSNSSFLSGNRRQGPRFSPYHLGKRCKFLMNAAYKRGISLSFVHPALSKNKANTSFFTISTDTIEWHVDWLFSSSNTLVKDDKVPETCVLIEAVRKLTNFTEYPHHRKNLEEYRGEKLDACL
ncbi:LOW QUALITY PROTEIN: box C/D snoRNA protein 1-like [Elysia marginata]|uniref:Box C/D snoRNA protein 1 n=1 Tax=Elysia marginata TaxID=1093978 RepID=A0AAV4F9S2_9GAST|nr:LOW QUALITY PROTEIN: box C/D snoRNA protein 1-like [Elysia marginata]